MTGRLRSRLSQTWLGKVYQADKCLFIVIFLFFSGTLLSNLLRLQTTPFFIWDMYSNRAEPKTYYYISEVKYNDTAILNLRHTWNEPAKNFITMPLLKYLVMTDHDSVDWFSLYLKKYWVKKHPAFAPMLPSLYNNKKDLEAFPAWYKRWLSGLVGQPLKNICVLDKKLFFEKDGSLTEMSSDTALFIP